MKVIRTAALVAAAGAAFTKAKEYARENPGKASDTIDKAESFVRGKAGPKYSDKVGKGSDALRKSLGLSPGASLHTPSSGTASGSPAGTSTSTAANRSDGSAPDGSVPGGTGQGFDPAI